MHGEMGHYKFEYRSINFQWIQQIPLSLFYLFGLLNLGYPNKMSHIREKSPFVLHGLRTTVAFPKLQTLRNEGRVQKSTSYSFYIFRRKAAGKLAFHTCYPEFLPLASQYLFHSLTC